MASGTVVGSEAVEIVPDARKFSTLLAKDMVKAGREARARFAEGWDTKTSSPAVPAPDPAKTKAQGRESGAAFAGSFDREVRTKVAAALKSLPDAKVGADATQADREIARLRASLTRLGQQRIGVDVDDATALNRLEGLQRKLAEVADADTASISVKVNATSAAAELDKIRLQTEALGAETPTIKVDADTAGAQAQLTTLRSAATSGSTGVRGLVAAGLLIGPALVPGIAAAAAGLVALAAGGLAVAAGAGVAAAGLQGIGDAVKDTAAAEKASVKDSAAAAAQRVASSRQIADAQRGVQAAIVAQDEASVRSARQVADAQRGVADARRAAADGVQSALARVSAAEDAQTRAARDAKGAQEALTNARAAARRELADLRTQLRDGALSEEQASLSLERAKERLAKGKFESPLDAKQADLDVRQAAAGLDDLRARNKELAAQKVKADRAGINGSAQVQAAQVRLSDAQEQQKAAAKAVGDAEAGVAQARIDGARRIADAQRRVTDAISEQGRSATRSAEAVVAAQRVVSRAQEDAALSASTASSAQQKAADSMADLTPEGRKFAAYILGLRGGLKDLRNDAQAGFLPGLQEGMQSAGKALSPFKGTISTVATAMGDLATSAGEALGRPEFQRFFGMVEKMAGPMIGTIGSIFGGLARAAAGLGVAFAPVAEQVLKGLDGLVDRFAAWANQGEGGGLDKIVNYILTEGPKFAAMLGDVGRAFGAIVVAVAPLAGPVMSAISGVANAISGMDTQNLTRLIVTLAGLALGWKTLTATVRTAQIAADTFKVASGAVRAVAGGLTSGVKKATAAIRAQTLTTRIAAGAAKAWAVAQRILNAVLRMNPIGLIITALVALGAGLVLAYQKSETFRRIVNGAWAAVKAAVQVVVDWWTNTAWPAISGFFTRIGDAMVRAKNKITGAWQAIKNKVVAVKNWITNTAWPALKRTLGKLAGYIPIVAIIKNWDTIKDTFRKAWNWVKDKFGSWWGGLKKIFTDPVDSAKKVISNLLGKTGLQDVFRKAREALGDIWGGIKDKFMSPLRSVMTWIDKNFISKMKGLLEKVNLGDVAKKIPFLTPGGKGFAAGGWTGPGSKMKPAGVVHADEFVVKKSSRRRFEQDHPGALDHINRHGTLSGYADGGHVAIPAVPGYAGGGRVFEQMVSWLQRSVPGAVVTSTNGGGHAKASYHYRDRAIDIGGPADIMRQAATAIQRTFGSNLAELIHNPGSSIKNGKQVPPSFWGGATWNNHRDHVHWAMESFGKGGMLDGLKGAWNNVTGVLGALAGTALEGGQKALTAMLDHAPLQDSMVGKLGLSPARLAIPGIQKLIDEGIEKLQFEESGGGDVGDGGSGVERWRSLVVRALDMTNQPLSAANVTLRRMMQESGGNPYAKNNWDSNARAGIPSQGLMQVIPPTFEAYAMPGHNKDITDPLSNILASMRYAVATYGNLQSAYGRAGGYFDGGRVLPASKPLLFDQGGMLPTGLSTVVNKTGKPEPLMRMDKPGLGGSTPVYLTVVDRDGTLLDRMHAVVDDRDEQHQMMARLGRGA